MTMSIEMEFDLRSKQCRSWEKICVLLKARILYSSSRDLVCASQVITRYITTHSGMMSDI